MNISSDKLIKVAILLLTIIVSAEVKSQVASIRISTSDYIVLHFRFDEAFIDSSYMSNTCSLKQLNELLSDHEVDSISISTSSSPEGISEHNIKLSKHRANSILNYIQANYHHINKNKNAPTIHCVNFVHTNWSRLYFMIKDDDGLPYKAKVLSILLSDIAPTRKGLCIKQIDKGASWEYLKNNYFPLLRTGSISIMAYKKKMLPPFKTLLTCSISNQADKFMTTEKINRLYIPTSNDKKTIFAVKTNLLFDAVTALNIELEFPVTDHWSIAGEWIFPWWLWNRKQYCLQVLSGNIEGKYWLGKREARPRMTGWFTGLYAGGGLYDIEWGTRGYQGEFFIAAGLSSGYAHTINKSRSLRMEYSLGIGYLRTNYREYEPMENGNILAWKRDGQYTWIGPTRAKISLVWLINRKVKKGGK